MIPYSPLTKTHSHTTITTPHLPFPDAFFRATHFRHLLPQAIIKKVWTVTTKTQIAPARSPISSNSPWTVQNGPASTEPTDTARILRAKIWTLWTKSNQLHKVCKNYHWWIYWRARCIPQASSFVATLSKQRNGSDLIHGIPLCACTQGWRVERMWLKRTGWSNP
jgi:hypothetical protein